MGVQNISHGTALHFAVRTGNIKLVRKIINIGCNVDIQDDEGNTALIIAVSNPKKISVEIVKLLLEANADILITAYNCKRSALKIVVSNYERKNKEIVEIFLERVKSLCEYNIEVMAEVLFFVNCPLEYIVSMKNAELTKSMLLKYDYEVDARNPLDNCTPLHKAVRKMDFENVKILVERGANVNAQDIYNQVPLSFYYISDNDIENHLDILRFLIENGTVLTGSGLQGHPSPISLILSSGTQRVVDLLLQYIDISAQANGPATLLHYLSFNKNPHATKGLKNKTFDVDVLDRHLYTPLMYAASICNQKTIKFLLKNGANVNYKSQAVTPILAPIALEAAWKVPRNTRHQYEICTEIFLQNGATLDVILPYPIPPPKDQSSFLFAGSCYIYYTIKRPILAYLAKLETLNQPINVKFREKIYSCPVWRRLFKLYLRDFRNMKNRKIYGSLNMFTLIEDVEMKFVQRYHCHSKIVSKLCSANRNLPNSYPYRQLKKRINKTTKILKTRVIATAFLSKILNLPNSDHIVTDKIINYLNYENQKKLVTLYSKCR